MSLVQPELITKHTLSCPEKSCSFYVRKAGCVPRGCAGGAGPGVVTPGLCLCQGCSRAQLEGLGSGNPSPGHARSHRRVWVGRLPKTPQFQPPGRAGVPLPRSGCPGPHPAWAWTPPGMGITEGESRGDGERAVVVFVRIHVTSTGV